MPAAVRPVSQQMRKSCFDILGEEIRGRAVLDLFAGSGALGIEAFSSGARKVVFVDRDKKCIETIKKNIARLGPADWAQVYLVDAFKVIEGFSAQNRVFDFIFLDPPYYQGILIKALQALEEYDILATASYLVSFSYRKDEVFQEESKFAPILDRKYGQSRLLIYRKR